MRKVKVWSDGFSTPSRRKIIKKYGQEVMDALDRVGYKHDARIEVGVSLHDARMMVFVDMFHECIIPSELMESQYFGLLAYDRLLPRHIKPIIRKITGSGRKEILVTVEI